MQLFRCIMLVVICASPVFSRGAAEVVRKGHMKIPGKEELEKVLKANNFGEICDTMFPEDVAGKFMSQIGVEFYLEGVIQDMAQDCPSNGEEKRAMGRRIKKDSNRIVSVVVRAARGE